MTKMTYSNALETVLALDSVKANAELFEKLTALKTSIEKKSTTKSGEKKPTANQLENAKIKNALFEIMKAEPNRMFTITELVKALGDAFGELSNQKISQIVRQMYLTDGTAERIEDKRKAYFKVVLQ